MSQQQNVGRMHQNQHQGNISHTEHLLKMTKDKK